MKNLPTWTEGSVIRQYEKTAPKNLNLKSSIIARHDEQGFRFKAFVIGTQSVTIVILLDIDDFFCAGDDIDRDIVIAAVSQADQPSVRMVQDQIEGQVSEGHRDNGIDRIR